jgi:hypothetical protein
MPQPLLEQYDSLNATVGLFFVANGTLLLHKCAISEAEPYGDFLNYPESHDKVWRREHYKQYRVDFDYFPRGRIVYNRVAGTYSLYHDACITDMAESLVELYPRGKCTAALDEHYQCHICNPDYVM